MRRHTLRVSRAGGLLLVRTRRSDSPASYVPSPVCLAASTIPHSGAGTGDPEHLVVLGALSGPFPHSAAITASSIPNQSHPSRPFCNLPHRTSLRIARLDFLALLCYSALLSASAQPALHEKYVYQTMKRVFKAENVTISILLGDGEPCSPAKKCLDVRHCNTVVYNPQQVAPHSRIRHTLGAEGAVTPGSKVEVFASAPEFKCDVPLVFDGVAIDGHDLDVVPLNHDTQCIDACRALPGCVAALTVSPIDRMSVRCHLKSEVTGSTFRHLAKGIVFAKAEDAACQA